MAGGREELPLAQKSPANGFEGALCSGGLRRQHAFPKGKGGALAGDQAAADESGQADKKALTTSESSSRERPDLAWTASP